MFEMRFAVSNVYATWTMSTSLFRLGDEFSLSSIIGSVVFRIAFWMVWMGETVLYIYILLPM